MQNTEPQYNTDFSKDYSIHFHEVIRYQLPDLIEKV